MSARSVSAWLAALAVGLFVSGRCGAVEGWAVFANGEKAYRCSIDSSPEELYSGNVAHACWSADGTYVYFLKTNGEIWRMNNDGSGAQKIANGLSTSYCPIAAYRPDPEYVLFVSGSNFYRINGATGAIMQIHSEPRNYVGETAINASGTRMAGRGSDSNLYRMTVGGASSQYATTCSSSISPNGNYLTANVGGHKQLTIHNWDGSVYKTLNAPPSHEWDNQKFAVNSNDYVVYNYDTASRIGCNYVPSDSNAVICDMWSSYPDLFIGSLPGVPSPNQAPTASISSPASGTSYSPGETINYSGSATDPEDGALSGSSLAWELDRIGDGQGPIDTATGGSGNYAFPTDIVTSTEYRLKLTATDSGGLTDSTEISVWVNPGPTNLPPTVNLSASPTSGTAPVTVNFDANSIDPDGDTLTHEWDWEYSGTFAADQNTGATGTNSHDYTAAGIYTAAVRVSDGQGHSVVDTIGISVTSATTNFPPSISSVSASPNPADVGVAVNFSCSATDPDSDPMTYSWDFGDGGTGSGASPSHSYLSSGDYTATVTVLDDHGHSVGDTVVVRVTTPTMIVIECEDMSNLNGYAVESGSGFDCIATLSTGTATEPFPGPTDSYRMKVVILKEDDGLPTLDVYVAGTLVGTIEYTLGASVRDPETIDLGVFNIANGAEIKLEGWLDGGAAARVDRIIFEAEGSAINRDPSISSVSADPNPTEVGQAVSFHCSATDPDGDTLSYSWAFQDAPPGSGASPMHTYTTANDYTVTVTVDDGNGGTDSGAISVTVNAPDMIVIECEDMYLDGYVVESYGELHYISTYDEGTAAEPFPGGTGEYRIRVTIIKEDDGCPTLSVYVGGEPVGTIAYPLGASTRDPQTVDLGTFNIAHGEEILLVGTLDSGAAARADRITFEYVGAWSGDGGPQPFHGVGGGCGPATTSGPPAFISLLTLCAYLVGKTRRKAGT